ncbi:MAG TPA: antitoxin Xre/MbcA/ParS toxin-binding domain-containing protein [Mycobacteriales bacterium]|jgi:putative toxin-antitoxin system antitoxin component (TIGR02293 family)|nr:antitoxin Xre/MbcA/ParS toxin-binding domain-containing protein [Mycobacteriales bacterium]
MSVATIRSLTEGDVLDVVDIARSTDATPRSVSRWLAGDVAPRRETEERLLELKAVLDLATRVFRPEVARAWMRSPVPALDYDKPLDLLRTGQWRRVVDELLALSEGVTT